MWPPGAGVGPRPIGSGAVASLPRCTWPHAVGHGALLRHAVLKAAAAEVWEVSRATGPTPPGRRRARGRCPRSPLARPAPAGISPAVGRAESRHPGLPARDRARKELAQRGERPTRLAALELRAWRVVGAPVSGVHALPSSEEPARVAARSEVVYKLGTASEPLSSPTADSGTRGGATRRDRAASR